MKVVLFCGGYGMRMRNEHDDVIPKPMQMVGPRPLHLARDALLRALRPQGVHPVPRLRRAGTSRTTSSTYQEAASNDFVMRDGQVELLQSDISDWSITFVDTGLESAIGERLRRVRQHLDGDEYFLANYADVLTDAPLDEIIDEVPRLGRGRSMMVVPPQSSFHCVDVSRGRRGQGHHPGADCPSGRTAATSS